MEEIIKGIYIGDDSDYETAKKRGWSILSACKDGPHGHRSMLGYTTLGAPQGKAYLHTRKGEHMALNLVDSPDPAMIPPKVLDAGLDFIKEQVAKGRTVLIHCNAGISRSPSIVMLYLHLIGELSQGYGQALHIFKTLYPKYDPGHGMKMAVVARW